MKIKIYQINLDRDEKRLAFMHLGFARTITGNSGIDSSLYDKVYEGDVECDNLEEVYTLFNLDHPAGFAGHSLSVSDVVEVIDEDGHSTFHFCDSVGFAEIPFEPELTGQVKVETMRVVLLEPGKLARITEIEQSLHGMQRVVCGDIEPVYPFEEQVCIVGNGESKLMGLPLNRAIREEDTITEMPYKELKKKFQEAEATGQDHLTGFIVFTEDSFTKDYPEGSRTYVVSSDNKAFRPGMAGYSIFATALDGSDPGVRLDYYMKDEHGGESGWKIERCYVKEPGRKILDIIAGTCFICDCTGEQFGSLTEEQAERYKEKYMLPERFVKVNDEIMAIPFKPKEKGQER